MPFHKHNSCHYWSHLGAFVLLLLWIGLSQTWKEHIVFKSGHLVCFIYHLWRTKKAFYSELHLLFPLAIEFILFSFIVSPPTISTRKPTQNVIHLSHVFAIPKFSYSFQSGCYLEEAEVHSIFLGLPLFEEKQNKLSLMNSLWHIMWYKTTFGVQGTTYAVPFRPSRLCVLSNGVGGSQWLLVIQRETDCHYAFVLNLRSHKVCKLSVLVSGWFVYIQPWFRFNHLNFKTEIPLGWSWSRTLFQARIKR